MFLQKSKLRNNTNIEINPETRHQSVFLSVYGKRMSRMEAGVLFRDSFLQKLISGTEPSIGGKVSFPWRYIYFIVKGKLTGTKNTLVYAW